MRIVHISDSHISLDHPQRALNMQSCIDIINAADEQPDVVVHTGDLAHTGVAEEYNITRAILDKLKAPYYVLVGNKDKRPAVIDAFSAPQRMQANNGFIQYVIDDYPVRMIMLDTLSENSNKGRLDEVRLTHLRQMLEADTFKPAVIFMHHTPFKVPPIPDPFQFEDWSHVEKLQDLLSQHTQLQGIYCGHIHRNVEGTLGALNVSAISCMASDLRMGELTNEERTMAMLKTVVI